MEIQQNDDGRKGAFFVEQGASIAAKMTYVWAGNNKIIIDHTEVNESLHGQNVGKQLVHHAVEFSRSKGIKIIPLCPFAKAVFEKTREYDDVLFNA